MISIEGVNYTNHGLLNLSAGVLNLSVGTIVLFQKNRAGTNRAFFSVTIAAFLWVLGFGMVSLSDSVSQSMLWVRVAYLGVPLISPTVFLLSQRWAIEKTDFLTCCAFLFGFLATIPPLVSPESVLSFTTHSWGRYVAVKNTAFARGYYFLLIAHFILFAILAIRNFWIAWRRSPDPSRRIQFRAVFIAFIIAYGGSVDFLVKLGAELYPSGCVWLSTLNCFIAYTILRHRTFEVDLVRNRFWLLALIYSALIAVALPVAVPLIINLSQNYRTEDFNRILLLSAGASIFISAGPVIFAYLVGQQFWLKRHVTASLTHELKSPLGAIRGATEMLRNANGNPNAVELYMQMLDRNTDRLERYVGDLLTTLKLRERSFHLEKFPIDLRPLIQEVIDTFAPVASRKGMRISLNEGPAAVFNFDREGISQVMSNLMSNAIKFSEIGTIKVEIKSDEAGIWISVTDEGRGITQEDLPNVFNEFFQGGGSAKGSGLGLSIAKGWVEAHGGRIWAVSKGPGRGTTVAIRLPAI